jgi:hypothetical protein
VADARVFTFFPEVAMHTTHALRRAFLALVAISTVSTPAFAEQQDRDRTRAEALFQQAVAMEHETSMSFSRHLRRTARLYLQSAELRENSDPLKVQSLERAGALLMSLDAHRSCRLLGRAAELALAHGDVVRATHLYIDGAWIIANNRSSSEADRRMGRRFVEQARLLAAGPKVSAQERATILGRIEAPALASGL